MTSLQNSAPSDGIAIIGMSGRFPGARTVSEFWSNLKNGVESINFFSDPEPAAHQPAVSPARDPNFVSAAGVLDEIENFDAPFFGFNPVEAATLDPQQRVLLECAWQAMEDAGYDLAAVHASVGVYAGCAMSTYLFGILSNPEHRKRAGDFSVFTGNDKDFLSTRISYKLNLRGPSVTVQTACSTSLVAIAMACDSLLAHQCDMALAGGVAIRVPQDAGYLYQEGQIFSRDGHTRSFDEEANGTVFTNGAGLVVLKRLDDAIVDRDCIRAVIKGAAINNDGSLKAGYAAPSLDAQAEVVAMAHALAGIDPRTIGSVEAHGTATPMGDSIEIAALTKAFRAHTKENSFCALGSVKSNVGHMDTASGVGALIKAVLSLQHRVIPPSINFQRPNPAIDFRNSPFYVNTQLREWPSGSAPRRAGVHSFGIGGTNAHIILEEAPAPEVSTSLRSHHLVVLSARTKSALQAAATSLASHLQQQPHPNIADVAYTCHIGRREFAHRQILVCRNRGDAIAALETADTRRLQTGTKTPAECSVAFVFPESGEYVNAAKELYSSEPAFRNHVDDCLKMLEPRQAANLRLLYSSENANPSQLSIGEDVAEVSLFVFEYALAQLWMEWGANPQAMMGQGIGEYVAACLAEVFSVEDALTFLAERNGTNGSKFARISLRSPKIPLVSSATGTWSTATEAVNPAYWRQQLRVGKRLAEGVACLSAASNRILLEVGPCDSIQNVAQCCPKNFKNASILSSLPGSNDSASTTEAMLNALGRLWLAGATIDWKGFWRHERRSRVPLPAYAFDRKRHWVEAHATPASAENFPATAPQNLAASFAEKSAISDSALCCATKATQPPLRNNSNSGSTDGIEAGVAQIWQRLLGVEHVGAYDNFFALGGHSMLGAQLLAALRSAFQVEIPLPSLFEVPTVAGMAERIRALH